MLFLITDVFFKITYSLICIDITKSTGICPHDIASTLQVLNIMTKKDGKVLVSVSKNMVEEHMARLNSCKEKRTELDPDSLRWMPLITSRQSSDDDDDDSGEASENEVFPDP